MKKMGVIFCLATILASADLGKEEAMHPAYHVELGYLATSGNSNAQTLNALLKGTYPYGLKSFAQWQLDTYYGQKEHEKTDERYRAHLLLHHLLYRRWFGYAEARFVRNIFEGYAQQYNGGAGIGCRMQPSESLLWILRGGYQYRRANFSDGTNETLHFSKAVTDLSYRLNTQTTLQSSLELLQNLEKSRDFQAAWTAEAKVRATERLSLKVGFELKYENLPPRNDDGSAKKSTDTKTIVTVAYDF